MTRYLYRCAEHGVREVVKPMREAAFFEKCPDCLALMNRVWTVPNMIMRPGGYNLKPGDKGYSSFRREGELGEIDFQRAAPAEDATEEYRPDPSLIPEPSEAWKQQIGEWAQANLN